MKCMRSLRLVVVLVTIVLAIFAQLKKFEGRDVDIMLNVKIRFSDPVKQSLQRDMQDASKLDGG